MARRVMKEFSILEISGVDRPAQVHARSVILKRDVTKETDTMTPEEKAKLEAALAEKEKADKRAADLEAQVKKQADELALAKSLIELTDAQRAYYAKQDDAGKAAFLKMDAAKRAEVIDAIEKASREANPVVFKSASGAEYRKNDDPRLIEMAKQRDVDAKIMADSIAKAEAAEFSKRAGDELGNLPGDVDKVKIPLLRAVSKMSAEERTGVEALLKAANTVMAKNFETVGFSGGALPVTKGVADANAELKRLAEEHAKSTNVTYAKAYETVINTPVGRDLYAKTINVKAA